MARRLTTAQGKALTKQLGRHLGNFERRKRAKILPAKLKNNGRRSVILLNVPFSDQHSRSPFMASPATEAVRRLVEAHWNGLVLFARQWSEDAEDIVQEAFMRRFQQTQAPADEVAWLYRVVRNEAISRSRRRRNRSAREAHVAVPESWFEPSDDRLDAREAARVLQELDAELREVVVMRLWGQATLQQIADVLSISVATAHRRYERALGILRERLEPKLVEQPTDDLPRTVE